jgi:hypothetical protein
MQDPEPPSGWTPTVSTIAGAGLGGSAAYLVIKGISFFFHQTGFDPTAYVALTAVCNGAIGYFFPDGGRK